MRKVLLAVAALALMAGGVYAGPNAGAVFVWHADQTITTTGGDVCGAMQLPATCDELVPQAVSADGVEWILMVLANTTDMQVSTLVWGLGQYDPGAVYIGYYGPCDPWGTALEIPTSGWPGPGEGTAVSWAPNCWTGTMFAFYYLGAYVYAPGTVPYGPHPTQNPPFQVVSCDPIELDEPACTDSYAGFGGAAGSNCCPQVPQEGACCFDGTCVLLLEEDCIAQGGQWVGGPCDPNPCQPPTAVEETTWGAIKNIYR